IFKETMTGLSGPCSMPSRSMLSPDRPAIFGGWKMPMRVAAGLALALAIAVAMAPTVRAQTRDENIAKCQEGDIDACNALAQSGKETPQDLASFYHVSGVANVYNGQIEKGIAELDKAIALDPKYARLYKDRGWAYEVEDMNDQAIADYTKAIAL